MTKKLLFVLGTRPEVIKLAPLFLLFKKMPHFQVFLLNTQQQKQLSNQTLRYFGLKADFEFSVMRPNQSLFELNARLMRAFGDFFATHEFDGVFVQGDTMSAYTGALAAFYVKIPIFHIEAGLRSKNLFEPFPEEAMRLMITRIATLHFAPTQGDKANLLKENVDEKAIFVSQNTVIDAILCINKAENAKSLKRLKRLGVNFPSKNVNFLEKSVNFLKEKKQNQKSTNPQKLCLVTIHRRENHNKIKSFANAILQLAKSHTDTQFILPLHPNPNVRFALENALKSQENVLLCEALNYVDLINVLKYATLVLTDSGGIQEEAPSFGVKVLVLRNFTERTKGLECGFSELVGNDALNIIKRADFYLKNPQKIHAPNPYGDFKASERIFAEICKFYEFR